MSDQEDFNTEALKSIALTSFLSLIIKLQASRILYDDPLDKELR